VRHSTGAIPDGCPSARLRCLFGSILRCIPMCATGARHGAHVLYLPRGFDEESPQVSSASSGACPFHRYPILIRTDT
jgi:hypothetical protein